VLDGFDEIKICTSYKCNGETLTEMPADLAQLAACVPVYETIKGWTKPTAGVTRYEDLPAEAKAYVSRLEEVSGVPAAIVSTGSDRDHTIIRNDSVVSKWLK